MTEVILSLKDVRLSFTRGLFEATSFQNGPGAKKFSVGIIIPKGSDAEKAVRAAMTKVAKDQWKDKAEENYAAMKAADKLALHDGDAKPSVAGYPGNFYMNASNEKRPVVVDRNKAPLTLADDKPYPGCYANVSVAIWAQDNKYGKRLNATIRGVQFVRDGERLAGGSVATADDFEEIPEASSGETTGSEMFA